MKNEAKALELVNKLFTGNKHTWPDDMCILVTVGELKAIQKVLAEDSIEQDLNAVGARRKE